MDKHSGSNSGIGYCGLLSILFIALKLTGFIHWSWLGAVTTLDQPCHLDRAGSDRYRN